MVLIFNLQNFTKYLKNQQMDNTERMNIPGGSPWEDVVGYSLLATGDQWQFVGPDGPVSVKVRPRLWSNNGDSCIAASVAVCPV